VTDLPDALLERFVGDAETQLLGVLRLLRPLSTTSPGKAGSAMAR
jgi:hypothetical protein